MPALELPFAHLNLRRNPFGDVPLAERAALAVADVDAPLRHLERPRAAVEFLAPCGHGKTTHLLAIAARRPGALFVRCAGRTPPPAPLLILDEAERLAAGARGPVFRRAERLVLAAHESLGSELRAAGFAQILTVRIGELSVERLRAIVDRRIEWARRAPGPVPRFTGAALGALLAGHGSDVRAIEGRLYEIVQGLAAPVDVLDAG